MGRAHGNAIQCNCSAQKEDYWKEATQIDGGQRNDDVGQRNENSYVSVSENGISFIFSLHACIPLCKSPYSYILFISQYSVNVNCKTIDELLIQGPKFRQRKPDFFAEPLFKGLPNRNLFTRATNRRPVQMPTDWTIINDVVDVDGRAHESSGASEILQGEHDSQLRTRNQHRSMSFTDLSFSGITPQMTSTPIRPLSRLSDRSGVNTRPSSRASLVNPTDLITPPTQFDKSTSKNSKILAPPSPFKSPIAPPPNWDPIDYDDDSIDFNPNNNNALNDVPSDTPHQRVNDEIYESEVEPVEHADLITTLGEESNDYLIVTKLIPLWQKKVHPIKMGHLVKKACKRLQAAKAFTSLLCKCHCAQHVAFIQSSFDC